MNNKKHTSGKSKLRTLIEGKGFYIALCTLVAIMGISIFSAYRKNDSRSRSAFDDEAWQQAVNESGVELWEEETATSDAEKTDVAETEVKVDIPEEITETKPEDTEPENEVMSVTEDALSTDVVTVSADSVPLPEPGEIRLRLPCTGEVINPCSLDELVYSSTMDDWRTHNGMDIAAKEGEAVTAAADGTVKTVYEDELLGVVVEIDHGGGVSTLYGNLQSYDFIRAGTDVLVGDIIGGVGKPGALENDSESHLHFEVHQDGEIKNPTEFIE